MATSTSTPATGREVNRRHLGRWLIGAAATVMACGAPPRGTIGAILIRKADGRIVVRDVPPHLAAARAGVRPGDELILIEGQDVRRLSEEDLRRTLTGAVNEPVQLTFVRGDEVKRVTIRRSMAEPYRVD